jgi:hypothetical protein
VEQSGMFSSRDKFLGKADGEYKPVDEVDERSVRQAAQTECFKKCIFTALGYGALTEEEAKKAGIKTTSGHTFDAAKGKQGGSSDTSQGSKDARAEIEVICKRLFDAGYQPEGAPNIQKPEDILQHVTANPAKKWPGWNSFRAIKETQLERILEEMRKIDAEALGS